MKVYLSKAPGSFGKLIDIVPLSFHSFKGMEITQENYLVKETVELQLKKYVSNYKAHQSNCLVIEGPWTKLKYSKS